MINHRICKKVKTHAHLNLNINLRVPKFCHVYKVRKLFYCMNNRNRSFIL